MEDYYALISFVLLTSITPGPNNISSFVFSLNYGYKKTLKYILGILFGTSIMLLVTGFAIESINYYALGITNYFKYLASAYIVYLAYKSLKLHIPSATSKKNKRPNFIHGLLLQLVNPKAVYFSLTLYTSFLSSVINAYSDIIKVALILPLATYFCVSIWALSGNFLLTQLQSKKISRTISMLMAVLLVFFAIKVLTL